VEPVRTPCTSLKAAPDVEFIGSPATMADWSARARRQGVLVGLVPTMGALHEGHLELVRAARATCGRVVCSIFVNPLQFSNEEDLRHYPRCLEEDMALLRGEGCDAVFAPAREAIFAGFTPAVYDLNGLDHHWEGASRPGHFQGVVNVVERLFFFTRPDRAFFGEKDRQQLTVLRHAARAQRWPERIVPCPTVRDADGLALSSRNLRLAPEERRSATVLHRSLVAASQGAFRSTVEECRQAALAALATEAGVEVDYFGMAHPETLEPLVDWGGLSEAVAMVAAQVGPVRLIDNITLRR